MGDEEPVAQAFPNSPGVVTVTWNHSGDEVFWFIVELESPSAAWLADRDKRAWTVTGLEPSRTYRFRVCAVYDFNQACSGFTSVTTFPPPPPPTPPPPPPPDAAPPLPAWLTTIESINFPGHVIRHRNFAGELSRVSSDLDRAEATFRVQPIGHGDQVRLEAMNVPGHYLRHSNFQIRLHRDDGSGLFRADSTWRVSRRGTYSFVRFEAVNFPRHYIRHADFGLQIGQDDGSDLFRLDSTWRRLPPPQRNSPVGAVSFQSVNYPGHFLRHRNSLGELSLTRNNLDRSDATFIVRPSLAQAGEMPTGLQGMHEIASSLESANFPGHFLRHQDFRIKLHPNDGSQQFRLDATFTLNDGGCTEGNCDLSFESLNLRGRFIRHTNFELWLARPDGTDLFNKDASWRPSPALTG